MPFNGTTSFSLFPTPLPFPTKSKIGADEPLLLSSFHFGLYPAALINGGVAKRTWEAGNPYPFAGLTDRVLAAEDLGARFRFWMLFEEEFEERWDSRSSVGSRFTVMGRSG